jgi:hypothetical protein
MNSSENEIVEVRVAESTLLYSTEVFVPTGTKENKNNWIKITCSLYRGHRVGRANRNACLYSWRCK